jgi:hypothetical protein
VWFKSEYSTIDNKQLQLIKGGSYQQKYVKTTEKLKGKVVEAEAKKQGWKSKEEYVHMYSQVCLVWKYSL